MQAAVAVLNAVVGHSLVARRLPLATQMELRYAGSRLKLDPQSMRETFPRAPPRLALWVHGLGTNERAWLPPDRPSRSFGARLRADRGYAPVYLRYNTGLHVSENGEVLAALLDRFVETYPVRIKELVLIGYSMGGLVVRSACHIASQDESSWLPLVRRTVYVGVPHLGAPLERLGKSVEAALRAHPNRLVRFAGTVGGLRSDGVKDLGFANLLRGDWEGERGAADPANRRHQVPLQRGMAHHLIVGTLARSERHVLSLLFGDGMISVRSGAGRALPNDRSPLFPQEEVRVLPKVSHLALPRSSKVYSQIREWCVPSKARR